MNAFTERIWAVCGRLAPGACGVGIAPRRLVRRTGGRGGDAIGAAARTRSYDSMGAPRALTPPARHERLPSAFVPPSLLVPPFCDRG